MKDRIPLWIAGLGLIAAASSAGAGEDARFENLGVPVTKAMLMATAVGPDATGKKELLYFDFAQTGSTLFLVAVDPDTGEARQYKAPVGPGAWALVRGPDEKMYLGTWESGCILRFDPQAPDKGLEVIGKPSETETYIWQYAIGKDGKLYGCTYGNAKLVSYDPKTGRMQDLGRMDDTQMYTRSVACGPTGKIYTGIGYGRANVVAYDPATRSHISILQEKYRTQNSASVHLGADGQVYAHCGNHAFRVEDLSLVPIPADTVVKPAGLALCDGRTVTVGEITAETGSFTLTDPKTGTATTRTFRYQGDGSLLFVVGLGPDEKVYGSTAMPLEMFVHDPATGANRHLGNPTSVNGELYSMLAWRGLAGYPAICSAQGKVYVAAGNRLLAFDPRDMRVVQTIVLPDTPLDISLGRHPDGLIWGLTARSVFAVDPSTGEVAVKAEAPVPIRCGFALRDDAIYFGSSAHLWRYRFR
ncbi:MAG TPA: hypothetical protein PK640_10045 [Verrucomicrobiota bacterium]|nr:hypothetical protein [Verrucomicrobiota bacterium]